MIVVKVRVTVITTPVIVVKVRVTVITTPVIVVKVRVTVITTPVIVVKARVTVIKGLGTVITRSDSYLARRDTGLASATVILPQGSVPEPRTVQELNLIEMIGVWGGALAIISGAMRSLIESHGRGFGPYGTKSSAHGAGNYRPDCPLRLQSFQSD